jgi:hypothetical protein
MNQQVEKAISEYVFKVIETEAALNCRQKSLENVRKKVEQAARDR